MYAPTRVSRGGAPASDIEDHARPPAARGLPDSQLVVGGALDLRPELVAGRIERLPPRHAADGVVTQLLNVQLAGEEAVHPQRHDERLQPAAEELFPSLPLDAEHAACAWLDALEIGHEPEHGEPRPLEE